MPKGFPHALVQNPDVVGDFLRLIGQPAREIAITYGQRQRRDKVRQHNIQTEWIVDQRSFVSLGKLYERSLRPYRTRKNEVKGLGGLLAMIMALSGGMITSP